MSETPLVLDFTAATSVGPIAVGVIRGLILEATEAGYTVGTVDPSGLLTS